MSSKDVDISRKCNGPCNCLWSNLGFIKAKTGAVKGARGYGYCTHEKIIGYFIGSLKYGNKPLQIGDGKKGGTSKLFSGTHLVVWEATTYFHEKYDGDKNRITKPLLLGVKESGSGNYTWYENTGNNKIWRKIPGVENKYPRNNRDGAIHQFKKELDRLACKLHHLHRVDIQNDAVRDNYHCQICGKYNVTVEPGSPVNGIYSRFNHTLTDDGDYHVTYGANLVKYKEPSEYSKSLSVDKNATISVYYWEGDEDRKNPLLIELKQASTSKSEWYENKSAGGNNKIWRKLEGQDSKKLSSSEVDLKTKLDHLSCALNKAVRINLGQDSGCHNSRDTKHNNRISTRHNATISKQYFLSAYEYTSKNGNKPFSVAEVLLKSNRQKIGSRNLIFKSVTKLSSYASSCDTTNPFLICVESNGAKKWYRRNTTRTDLWEEDNDLSNQIVQIFGQVKNPLRITECPKYTPPKEGVQINITEQPKDGQLDAFYVSSGLGAISILITRNNDELKKGFFKNVHKVATGSDNYVISRKLQGGGEIGRGTTKSDTKIPNVENVQVYFWDGEPEVPILLRIIHNNHGKPEYYGKGPGGTGKTWSSDQVKDMTEQQALDHQNCRLNNAIPIELTEPGNLKQFHKNKPNSTCLPKKVVSRSQPGSLPLGAKQDYKAEGYRLTHDTKISRLTYNDRSTDIIPPYYERGPLFHLYYWKDYQIKPDNIPLLVEFLNTDGKSTWYENLGGKEPYTSWGLIGKKETEHFYDNQKKLTEEFTKKIHEVNCRIHEVVQINVSRKAKRTYCHNILEHEKRIKVAPELRPTYQGFTGYEHIPANTSKTLTISSFYNGDVKQNVHGNMFPLENVKKVTVYFPKCDVDSPVAIKIESSHGQSIWLKNENGKEQWIQFNPSGENNIATILGELKANISKCKETQGLPIEQGIQNPSTLSRCNSSESEDDDSDILINDGENQDYGKMLTNLENFGVDISTAAGGLGISILTDIVDEAIKYITGQGPAPKPVPETASQPGSPQPQDPQSPTLEAEAAGSPSPASTTPVIAVPTLPNPNPPPPPPQPAQQIASGSPIAEAHGKTSHGNSQTDPNGWKVIFGGSASATVVSGSLTGFGWWMFKRSKGYPWVRQI